MHLCARLPSLWACAKLTWLDFKILPCNSLQDLQEADRSPYNMIKSCHTYFSKPPSRLQKKFFCSFSLCISQEKKRKGRSGSNSGISIADVEEMELQGIYEHALEWQQKNLQLAEYSIYQLASGLSNRDRQGFSRNSTVLIFSLIAT